MYEGAIVGELDPRYTTAKELGLYMAGAQRFDGRKAKWKTKGQAGQPSGRLEAFLSVAASLICIVIGLLLGLVVLAIINAEHAFGDGLLVILKSG